MTAQRLVFAVLALAWMGLIFHLSSKPGIDVPPLFVGQDKLAHVIAFGILGLFVALAALRPAAAFSWRQVLLTILLVTAYGLLDEYHQSFVPGRDSSAWDVLADAIGGLLAALTVRRLRALQLARRSALSR